MSRIIELFGGGPRSERRRAGRPLPFAVLAGILSPALAACGGDGPGAGEWTGTIDTLPNGAVLVENPETGVWGEGEGWRLVEELRIGTLEGDTPDGFGQIGDLAVDALGRIHVLERQALEIRTFGPDGEHLRTVGRSGEGPGEIGNPMGMTMGPDDATLWLVDGGNARFSVYDTVGVFLRSHPRPGALFMSMWPGRFLRDGSLMDVGLIPGEGIGLVRLDPELVPADTFRLPSFEGRFWEHSTNGGGIRASVPFSPGLVWTVDSGGRLWWGVNEDYRFVKGTPDGDTLRVIAKEWRPEPVGREERELALEQMEWFTNQGGSVRPGDIPSEKPAFGRIMVDDRGHVWVVPFTWGLELWDRFDVFDPEGRYLGRIESETGLAPAPRPLFRDGYLYGVTRDDFDVPYVVRLRVERGTG